MEPFTEDLQRLDDELAEARATHARLGAKIDGLVAERDAIERAMVTLQSPAEVDVSNLTKDRAIVAALRAAGRPLRIGEIVAALNEQGRAETYNIVSVYLNMLVKSNRVVRIDRGLYRPA